MVYENSSVLIGCNVLSFPSESERAVSDAVCHQRHTKLARDDRIFLLHKIRKPENENETQCEENAYEVHVTHSGESKESESAMITLTISENKPYGILYTNLCMNLTMKLFFIFLFDPYNAWF